LSFVRDSLGILAQWPGLLALGMIVQIILARWLGPAGRGAYALALLWSNTLAVICSLGFEQANVYHVASGRHSVRQAISNSLYGALLAGLLAAAVSVPLIAWHPPFLRGADRLLLAAGTGVVPVHVFWLLLFRILQGQQRNILAHSMYLIHVSLSVVGCLILVVWAGMGPLGAIVVRGTSGAGVGLVLLLILRRHLSPEALVPSFRALRDNLLYGVRQMPAALTDLLNQRISFYIIAAFAAGTAALGYYAQGIALTERISILAAIAGTVLFPHVSKYGSSSAEFTARLTRCSLLVMAGAGVAVACLLHPLILVLFGRAYLPAVVPTLVFLPGVVVRGGTRVLLHFHLGVGRPGTNSVIRVGALAVNVLLCLILIPKLALIGASVAFVAGALVELGMFAWSFRRITGIGLRQTLVPTPDDVRFMFTRLVSVIQSRLRR